MISWILFLCAFWSLRLGKYFSYILERKKQDEVDTILVSAYVATSDFKSDGIVRRAAKWYVSGLEEVTGNKKGVARVIQTVLSGFAVGFTWALIIWAHLNGTNGSFFDFFFSGNLNATLLVGAVEVALVFAIDVWIVALIAKAVNSGHRIIGSPLIAVLLSLGLMVFSWTTLSGAFSATSLLGVALRDGSIPGYIFEPSWLLNRWWNSLINSGNDLTTVTLLSTGRKFTSSEFGFPAAIASCSFLLMIVVTWITELSGTRLAKQAASFINIAHVLWTSFTKIMPHYSIRTASYVVSAIFLALAFASAVKG